MSNRITAFMELFRGRGDVRGSWNGSAIKEPVTRNHFGLHLAGSVPDSWMGVYPHLGPGGDQQCSWGCIDIDGADFPFGDALSHDDYDRKTPHWHDWEAMNTLAWELSEALSYKNVYAYVERTRNGFHVWVFPDNPPYHLVSAATMRRALMAACQVCDYDPKEVYPKQETLQPGKIGNYARLPYYGTITHGTPPDRYIINREGEPLTLQQFLDSVKRTPVANLEAIARLWTPPVVEHTIDPDAGLEAEQYVKMLDGLSYTVWKDGPLPGKDRSSTLSRLAHLCAEQGLPIQIAYAVVASADKRWCKFHLREDGQEQIIKIVEHAYAK